MSSTSAGKFQDHYLVLGIDPKSDSDTIQRAYTHLAAKFHANNRETADPEKFQAVTQAYEVLADPSARETFDAVRSGPAKDPPPQFSGEGFFHALAAETVRRQCILCVLYDRRRLKPLTPSLSARMIETLMTATYDEIQFSLWYLKQRAMAVSDDKSNVQITVQGMEFLEKEMPRADSILPLLKAVEGSNPAHSAKPGPAAAPAPAPKLVAPSPPAPSQPPDAPGASRPQPSLTGTAPRTLSLPRKTIVIPPRSG